jgi:hypothetical protein
MAAKIERKAFDKPDETRPFKDGKGKVEVVTVGEEGEAKGQEHQNLFHGGPRRASNLRDGRRTPNTSRDCRFCNNPLDFIPWHQIKPTLIKV